MTKSRLVVVFFTLLFPLVLIAAEPTKVPRTPLDQVHFDASTTRAFDRSGRYVTTRVKANGTVETELNGSFQNVTVARMGPGGEIETYCTTDEQDAKNWMAREDGRPQNTAINAPGTKQAQQP